MRRSQAPLRPAAGMVSEWLQGLEAIEDEVEPELELEGIIVVGVRERLGDGRIVARTHLAQEELDRLRTNAPLVERLLGEAEEPGADDMHGVVAHLLG